MSARRDRATAGVKRRSIAAKAAGRTVDVYLSAEDTPRPNRALAGQYPHQGEQAWLLPMVRAAAKKRGLPCFHTPVSFGARKGWPDTSLWGSRFIARELKGSDGRVTVAQLNTINGLREAGIDANFWWVEDWYLGIIEAEMDALLAPATTVTALPPLVGRAHPAAPPPVRDPNRLYRFCGCPADDVHTCKMWGPATGCDPWKVARLI